MSKVRIKSCVVSKHRTQPVHLPKFWLVNMDLYPGDIIHVYLRDDGVIELIPAKLEKENQGA